MTPHYTDHSVTLYHGDCLDILREMPDQSVDAVVTDPPYGLEFMGKEWDAPWKAEGAHWREASRLPGSHSTNPTPRPQNFGTAGLPFQQWCELWATECLRVLKPGGHMLAFGGTRTFHRLACAVEDAGFELRDSIAWLYGSGFPKSLDVSKAIDKAAGAEREVVGPSARHVSGKPEQRVVGLNGSGTFAESVGMGAFVTAPATDAARQWQGWGTALKPAFEPVVVARKPLAGTVAANVTAWGVGALNVDGCRIGDGGGTTKGNPPKGASTGIYGDGINGACDILDIGKGRWPANVILDESQADALDQMSGERPGFSGGGTKGAGFRTEYVGGSDKGWAADPTYFNDSGGASRFFYTAKAPTAERPRVNGVAHPTTKPLSLMRWLVRLVTPPGGTVLEPFAGSGTTVEACIIEGFQCIAVEREADYLPLIVQRVNRQRDPIAYTATAGEDLGLFELFNEGELA